MFVLLCILLQHIGGVTTLLSASKKNPGHKKFAFVVANLARVIVCLGWLMIGDQTNLLYMVVTSAVLFIASFYNAFLVKRSQKVNPEESNDKNKSA